MRPYRGTLRWDPMLGPYAGTLRWDHMVGLYGGILRWDPIVGPYDGTLTWDPMVGLVFSMKIACLNINYFVNCAFLNLYERKIK